MITTGSDGDTCSSRPRWAPAGVHVQVERPRRGRHPTPQHVLGERRHRQLLRDLRLAHERSASVTTDEEPLAHELVERGAHREARDAEVVDSWRSEGIASPTPSCSIRSSTWVRAALKQAFLLVMDNFLVFFLIFVFVLLIIILSFMLPFIMPFFFITFLSLTFSLLTRTILENYKEQE